jgi:hypothetical protein
VAGALTSRHLTEERGELFGKAFEHFIFMELRAHRSLSELPKKVARIGYLSESENSTLLKLHGTILGILALRVSTLGAAAGRPYERKSERTRT